MEKPVLIDSNVYITLLRAGKDPAKELTRRYSTIDLATCGMVRLEVLRGITGPQVSQRLSEFFEVLQNVPSDAGLWDSAIQLAWDLDRKGQVIPATDVVIAASALRIGAIVFTYDHHFDVVPGLEIIRDVI